MGVWCDLGLDSRIENGRFRLSAWVQIFSLRSRDLDYWFGFDLG
jgi:hypothetical protein